MPTPNGRKWRDRRMAKGWSEQTAAGHAAIDPRTLASVEEGKPANYKTINALANCYGIGEEELPSYLVADDAATPSVPEPLPPPHLSLHPYSGRWNFRVECSRWEGEVLRPGESVIAGGLLDLLIREDGRDGVGTAHGTLYLELLSTTGDRPRDEYVGRLRVVDRVDQVRCTPDGVLTFFSHTWARHPELGMTEPPTGNDKRGPTIFRWTLSPKGEEGVLEGSYSMNVENPRDVATVRLERTPAV